MVDQDHQAVLDNRDSPDSQDLLASRDVAALLVTLDLQVLKVAVEK